MLPLGTEWTTPSSSRMMVRRSVMVSAVPVTSAMRTRAAAPGRASAGGETRGRVRAAHHRGVREGGERSPKEDVHGEQARGDDEDVFAAVHQPVLELVPI